MPPCSRLLVNVVLKASYERMQPHFEDPLLVLTSFSFPSGHAAGATLFHGVLAAFLVSRTYDWRRRAAMVAGAIVAVALVAFSRMYLDAHYLSDVLAAICSSTVWLVLCLSAGHALVRGRLRLEWLAGAVIIFLVIAGAALAPDDWWGRFEDAMAATAGVDLSDRGRRDLRARLGLAAALLAVGVAALAGWTLSRHVLRRWIEPRARVSRTFKAIDLAVAKEPRKVVALLRMTPVIPCALKSYFLGLTRVRLDDYLLASLGGVLPELAVKVYLGAAGREVLAHGSAANWTLFALGLAALAGLTWLVGHQVRAKLAL